MFNSVTASFLRRIVVAPRTRRFTRNFGRPVFAVHVISPPLTERELKLSERRLPLTTHLSTKPNLIERQRRRLGIRIFGTHLEPRYIFRAGRLDQ